VPLAGRVDQLLAADHTLQGNNLARLLRLALKIYLIGKEHTLEYGFGKQQEPASDLHWIDIDTEAGVLVRKFSQLNPLS
jgi:hypothetical protein